MALRDRNRKHKGPNQDFNRGYVCSFLFNSQECLLFAHVFACWRACAVVFQGINNICVAFERLFFFVNPLALIAGIMVVAVLSLEFRKRHWNA